MEAFFTRGPANAGRRLPLVLPDGTDTGEWLHVLGVDSDAFQAAQAEMQRAGLRIAELADEGARFTAFQEEKLNMVARLVSSWSFPQECTFENVRHFLREAPQVTKAIDNIASNRRLFYKG